MRLCESVCIRAGGKGFGENIWKRIVVTFVHTYTYAYIKYTASTREFAHCSAWARARERELGRSDGIHENERER